MNHSINLKREVVGIFWGIIVVACMMTTGAAAKCSEMKIFPKKQLKEDAIQLCNILEESHPDPYTNGGGKVAFHRRLHRIINTIPDAGMEKASFFQHLLPLIACIGDSHTALYLPAENNIPSGLPLEFKISDDILYVFGISVEKYTYLLGAKLVSIEDIQFSDLVERQKKLKGFDNKYTNLNNLNHTLGRRFYLKSLLPEWRDANRIKAEFKLISGRMRTEQFAPLDSSKTDFIEVESGLPQFSANGGNAIHYGFMEEKNNIAWLKIADMWNYRENFEMMLSFSSNAEKSIKKFYQEKYGAPSNGNVMEILSKIPSATDTFRDLVKKMKTNAAETLIVDLRDNPGGNSYMRNILLYFLYGRESFISADRQGYQIKKYSDLYYQIYDRDLDGDTRKKKYVSPGGYDFSEEENYNRVKNGKDHDADKDGTSYYLSSPTFKKEWDSGKFAGYYHPSRVMVICSSTTYSAAFDMVLSLRENKAVIVGSPSGQSANCFIDKLGFTLKHTGIQGGVSFKQSVIFPNDPIKGNILMPDHQLTYAKLASYNFDPNSAVRLALEAAGLNLHSH